MEYYSRRLALYLYTQKNIEFVMPTFRLYMIPLDFRVPNSQNLDKLFL